MVHSTASTRLSEVIEAALGEAQITLRQVEAQTGLARTTLSRRLRLGGWMVTELEAIATLLGTDVTTLIQRAEGEAA
jgi:lambda repressor-like predicted transcriptional regulator